MHLLQSPANCQGPPPDSPLPVIESTPDGLKVISSKHLRLITDLPITEPIARLPGEFDEALAGIADYFQCSESRISSWRGTAYLMGDRQRFVQGGYIPAAVPQFQHGYQMDDEMWVMDQPSDYYRRHLLFHEGTHWFMNKYFGNAGPPWYMEGMADYLATHRFEGADLKLAILPRDNNEVPYWGRTKLIRDELAAGAAPSLEAILRYNATAHQNVSAYAWSWAAVTFLENHPTSQAAFRKISATRRLDATNTISRTLFTRLKDDWSKLRLSWQAFISEIDYGYDFQRGLLIVGDEARPLPSNQVSFDIAADRSWQSTGLLVAENQTVEIRAEGEFTIVGEPQVWPCQAGGVTLRYHEGRPLGILLAAIVPIPTEEPPNTLPWPTQQVGLTAALTSKTGGLLFFKINEAASDLADNSGALKVIVSGKP